MANKSGYKNSPVGWIPLEWEVKKLEEISQIVRGSSPRPAGSPKYFNGDYIPWLTVASMTNLPDSQVFVKETEGKLTEDGAKQSRQLADGILILANSGATLGIAKILGIKCCANDGIAAFLNLKPTIDKFFLCYFLNSKTQYFREVVAPGNGQPNLNTELIGCTYFPLPALPEQHAIAAVLRACDETLEKTQALLAALRRRHAGLMQALLSGKKRLKGFEGEKWNEFEIQEIGEVIRGASPRPQGDPRFFGGTVPRLMVEDVTRDGKFVIPKVDFLTEEGAKKSRPCKKGTLTVVCSGTVGVPSILAVDACIHDGFLAIINLKDNIDLDFLYYQLFQVKEKMERSATHGGVFTNLTTSILKEFKILLPSLPEQRAITAILQASEAEIRGYERQATLLQRQKKGLMQVLLTGKVRVKKITTE